MLFWALPRHSLSLISSLLFNHMISKILQKSMRTCPSIELLNINLLYRLEHNTLTRNICTSLNSCWPLLILTDYNLHQDLIFNWVNHVGLRFYHWTSCRVMDSYFVSRWQSPLVDVMPSSFYRMERLYRSQLCNKAHQENVHRFRLW